MEGKVREGGREGDGTKKIDVRKIGIVMFCCYKHSWWCRPWYQPLCLVSCYQSLILCPAPRSHGGEGKRGRACTSASRSTMVEEYVGGTGLL